MTAGRRVTVVRPEETAPKRGRHVLAVPGTKAPLLPVDLPAAVTGEARLRVARQQIADRTGIPSDALAVLPFDAGVRGGAWDKAVAVDRSDLGAWAERSAAGCLAILPDYLTLEAEGDEVAIIGRSGMIIARLGEADGFAAPEGAAAIVLKHALERSRLTRAVIGPGVPEVVVAVVEAAGLQWRRSDRIDLETVPRKLSRHDLRRALVVERSTGIGVWLTAAGLAVLAVGLWATSIYIETQAIDEELAAVRSRTEAVLRDGLLPAGPLLDIRAQLDRVLAERAAVDDASGDLDGIELLSRTAGAVFRKGVEVVEIGLAGAELTLVVAAPDFALAEALVPELAEAGLAARAESLRAREDGNVEARFFISPAEVSR